MNRRNFLRALTVALMAPKLLVSSEKPLSMPVRISKRAGGDVVSSEALQKLRVVLNECYGNKTRWPAGVRVIEDVKLIDFSPVRWPTDSQVRIAKASERDVHFEAERASIRFEIVKQFNVPRSIAGSN